MARWTMLEIHSFLKRHNQEEADRLNKTQRIQRKLPDELSTFLFLSSKELALKHTARTVTPEYGKLPNS